MIPDHVLLDIGSWLPDPRVNVPFLPPKGEVTHEAHHASTAHQQLSKASYARRVPAREFGAQVFEECVALLQVGMNNSAARASSLP